MRARRAHEEGLSALHLIEDEHEHDHSHGLVDRSILRSRAGIKAVSLSLAVLSVALLADLIHNFGDALTAIPLGLAFFFRSLRGERVAGLAVVLAIFITPWSRCFRRSSVLFTLDRSHTSGCWRSPGSSASSATRSPPTRLTCARNRQPD